MANYLAGINLASRAASGRRPTTSALASRGIAALTSLVNTGGIGGAKPKALHTEYASGEASWQKPYGSGTDIVFYMVRADKK